jgi:hypothetical protein
MKTLIVNRFDKSFGPAGSFAGIVLSIVGLALSYFNLAVVLLLFFGVFIAFTHTSTTINTKEKKALFSTNLFGIIKIGKWLSLSSDMQAKILKNNKSFRAYSRGNRTLVLKSQPFKAALFNKDLIEIMPLKYFDNLADGQQFVADLNAQLFRK